MRGVDNRDNSSLIPISLVLPTRNRARFLPTMLESVLDQMGPEDELLISDNHSTDNTRAVLSKMIGARSGVRVISPPVSLPIYPHWNFAISAARHQYVAFINDDEIYHSRLLQWARRGFSADPEVVAVVGGIVGLHCYFGGRLPVGINRRQHPSLRVYGGLEWLGRQSGHAPCNCILFRRPARGFRFLDLDAPYIDTVIYYQLARMGKIAQIPICVTTHLMHGANDTLGNFTNPEPRSEAYEIAAEDAPNSAFQPPSLDDRLPALHYLILAHLHAARRAKWSEYAAVIQRLRNDWPLDRRIDFCGWLAGLLLGRLVLRAAGFVLYFSNEIRRFWPPSRVLGLRELAEMLEQPEDLVRRHVAKVRGGPWH